VHSACAPITRSINLKPDVNVQVNIMCTRTYGKFEVVLGIICWWFSLRSIKAASAGCSSAHSVCTRILCMSSNNDGIDIPFRTIKIIFQNNRYTSVCTIYLGLNTYNNIIHVLRQCTRADFVILRLYILAGYYSLVSSTKTFNGFISPLK